MARMRYLHGYYCPWGFGGYRFPTFPPEAMAVEVVLSFLLLSLVVISLLLNIMSGRRYRQIPMAPKRLPFVGNAHNIDMSQSHITLTELAKTLGPIFRFKLYKEEIVVLNDYDTISEALVTNGHHIAGRPPMYRTSKASRSSHSIVWQTYTPKLIFLRKEVQRCLKMYGSGLLKLEESCAPEILQMLETIGDTKQMPFDPWGCMFDAVSTVMLSLILGHPISPSTSCLQKLRDINYLFNSTFGPGSARKMDYVPWKRVFPCKERDVLEKALKMRDEFWNETLLQMEGSSGGVVNRLMSLTQGDEKEQFDLTENTAKEVFTNLILAGTDTTSTALTCLLLFLLHYPDVQEKLHKEVVEVVGVSRLPSLSDKQNMPYTEATLMELLRILAHVPLAVPHYTVCDTTIQGKHVPADTTVYINLWAMLHDETFWQSPWKFRPERFLDDNNKLLPPSHPLRRRMLAFGAGRRVCLGEILAKNRLFLFAAAVIQNFRFEASKGEPVPDADPRTYEMGLVIHPKPFRLCAIRRHDQ